MSSPPSAHRDAHQTILPVLFDRLGLDDMDAATLARIMQIDALLPQTQCGLCGHADGCLPYAHSIVTLGEAYNRCVPGGDEVTQAIFAVLKTPSQSTGSIRYISDETPLPATPSKWQTDPATHRPIEVRAVIDERECIGCTKCIPACPVDAIIGTAKHMHTIITELCTGCELCLPPCPVDCISLVPHPRTLSDDERQHEQANLKKRYHQHLHRVAKAIADGSKPVVSTVESAMTNAIVTSEQPISRDDALTTIEMAKLRTQIKKLTKQLSQRDNPTTQATLDTLTARLNALMADD